MGFRSDTRSGILWCHPLPCDASAAVIDINVNYDHMRMDTGTKNKNRKWLVLRNAHKENKKAKRECLFTLFWVLNYR